MTSNKRTRTLQLVSRFWSRKTRKGKGRNTAPDIQLNILVYANKTKSTKRSPSNYCVHVKRTWSARVIFSALCRRLSYLSRFQRELTHRHFVLIWGWEPSFGCSSNVQAKNQDGSHATQRKRCGSVYKRTKTAGKILQPWRQNAVPAAKSGKSDKERRRKEKSSFTFKNQPESTPRGKCKFRASSERVRHVQFWPIGQRARESFQEWKMTSNKTSECRKRFLCSRGKDHHRITGHDHAGWASSKNFKGFSCQVMRWDYQISVHKFHGKFRVSWSSWKFSAIARVERLSRVKPMSHGETVSWNCNAIQVSHKLRLDGRLCETFSRGFPKQFHEK